MLKGLKSKNPDKDYPSNLGQKWTEEEETLLLEELSKNIDIQLIAQCHNRTTGGIDARRREIAYKMYINDISMEDIIRKTKLDEHYINETIQKRNEAIQRRQNKQNNTKNNATKCKSITEITTPFSIKSEMDEMKKDITDIKNTIKELVEMMKAVYEFEDA